MCHEGQISNQTCKELTYTSATKGWFQTCPNKGNDSQRVSFQPEQTKKLRARRVGLKPTQTIYNMCQGQTYVSVPKG